MSDQRITQLEQDVADIKLELSRKQDVFSWSDQLPDDKALELFSNLGRRHGVQVYQAENGEVALWELDKESDKTPADPEYQGSKIYVITAATS